MAHLLQQQFCDKVRNNHPEYFKNKKVLDIGSLDINGNNRFLFTDCEYTGLDVGEGPNVDVISIGHLFEGPDEYYDTIISTEVFEHDMFYEDTIKNIMRMLKPNGMFIFTCASTGRAEHGTRNSDGSDAAPLLIQVSEKWSDYYKNLTQEDIIKIDGFKRTFPDGKFEYQPEGCDLYFYGVKGGINNHLHKKMPNVLYDNDDYSNHIFVVDSWPDTIEKEKTLVDCIMKLREFNIEILLVGHYPIKPEIQKMVDYYIFDKNNPILLSKEFSAHDVSSGRWTKIGNYYVDNKHEFHHDYAIWETMRNAFNFCNYLGKKYIHFMEYDNVIDSYQFKQAFIEEIVRNDSVIYEYHENSKDLNFAPYMATYIFSIRTEIALKVIEQINSKFEYFYGKPEGWQLERVFLKCLRNITNSIFLTKYIANNNELNIHAVWNRDGILKGGAIFQIYPCVNKNGDLYIHLISGFHDEKAKDDYLIEIRYQNINRFVELKKGTYELINVGKYQKGSRVKIYSQGVNVYNEFLDKSFDEFHKLNSVKFDHDSNDVNVGSHFVDGPFVDVKCERQGEFLIEFIDQKTDTIVFSTKLNSNAWAKATPKYFIDWKIRVWEDKNIIYERKLDYNGHRVFISFESKSLGDNLAWIPIVEQFRKKHNCKVVCSTFWNNLFKTEYPEIEFVEPGQTVENIVAQYRLGLFYNGDELDMSYHFNDVKKEPLQKIASDILGLEFVEERPKVIETKPSELKGKKYVCIAPHATSLAKYWNRPNGWQEVTNFLNENGYEVVYISSESMNDDWHNSKLGGRLKKVTNKGGNYSIEDRISDLRGASAFIGVSSGLSWLSWACGTQTVLISGFTDKHLEFQDCHRIINKNVCHGCWHFHKLDPGNWRWCPEHEKTDREFECTKTISSEEVIEELKKIIF